MGWQIPTWYNPSLPTGGRQQCHLHFLGTLFLWPKHPLILIPFFMLQHFPVGFMSRSSSLDLWVDLSRGWSTQNHVAQIILVCSHKLWLYFHPETTLFSFLDGCFILSSVREQHEIANTAWGTHFATHKSVCHEPSLTLKLLKTVFLTSAANINQSPVAHLFSCLLGFYISNRCFYGKLGTGAEFAILMLFLYYLLMFIWLQFLQCLCT